ncbi:flavodoxin family protein [Candidatus Woesearchaeota archaeon]|nr:flavodoxin family protein [Candidatus Woesearchaeota archaeon]
MPNKNALIICQSIHHGNTMKVAKVIAEQLNAEIKKPSEVKSTDISKCDLIGLGSGIYNGKHHISLFKLVKNLELQKNKRAFIFSTASICYKKMHEPLRQELISKGFDIIDEFICRGFIDYSFIKYFFGGLNKKRPNEKDLTKAKDFALKIKDSF